jgi:hypothetical protein
MDSRNGTRAVSPIEMASRIGVATGTAGLNSNFFIEVGRGKYKPTEATLAFNREAGSGQAASAMKNLAPPLSQTWFFNEVKSQVALGDQMETRIITVLGNAAGARGIQRAKLLMLLEWLKFASLIVVSDGQVRLVDGGHPDLRSKTATTVVRIQMEVTIA